MKLHKLFRHVAFGGILMIVFHSASNGQDRLTDSARTPHQHEIARQQARLSSAEGEERRDALARLGSMHHPEASRAALSALNDSLPIVRATAVAAVLYLPPSESAPSLIPLLSDKDEFVRRETAYALGKTRSRSAVPRLSELLLTDKEDGVRGAAAVALGQIGDREGVAPLSAVLSPELAISASKKNKKARREQNPFVLRSAARSLGQIASDAGTPPLIAVLQNPKAENDLRREAAIALGKIGASSALPALRDALGAGDPYLAEAASEAIKRISNSANK